jgi:hypothetical protein
MGALVSRPEFDTRRSQVLDELEGRVQDELIGRVRDFRLALSEGGLVLRGRASTYYAKQLAQEAVMRATNWPIAANDVAVY